MSNVLLISTATLKASTIIENNVDDKLLSKIILTTQEVSLRPILGSTIYSDLLGKVSTLVTSSIPLTDLYSELLNDYIKPYLIHAVTSEFIIVNSYRMTNKGVMRMDDSSANAATEADLESAKDYYDNYTASYKKRLLDFLVNSGLVKQSELGDSDITSQASGWFLDTKNGYVAATAPAPIVEKDPIWLEDKSNYYNKAEIDSILLTLDPTESDPVWMSEKVNYYNKSEIDSIILSVNPEESDPIWMSEKVNYYTKTQADSIFLETESDPIWMSEKVNYYNKTETDALIAAVDITETDPVFSAHASSSITNSNITNWNDAHSWGNHASANYLTSIDSNLVAIAALAGTSGLLRKTGAGIWELDTNSYETSLGNPATNGFILSSNTDGTRSWIAAPSSLSGLTAGRIPYAATATSLVDSANMKWDDANLTLTLGGNNTFKKTASDMFEITGGTGGSGGLKFSTRYSGSISFWMPYYSGTVPTLNIDSQKDLITFAFRIQLPNNKTSDNIYDLANGQMYYRSDLHAFRGRVDSAWKSFVMHNTLTATRVPFALSTTELADSANFVWDNTNSRLRIGGVADQGAYALQVAGSILYSGGFHSTQGSGTSAAFFSTSTGLAMSRQGAANRIMSTNVGFEIFVNGVGNAVFGTSNIGYTSKLYNATKSITVADNAGSIEYNIDIVGSTRMSDRLTMSEINTPATPTTGRSSIYPKADGLWYTKGSDGTEAAISTILSYIIAVSDETTDITTGVSKVTFRVPHAMKITDVRASLNVASSSGNPTIDIKENGVSILSTKITIEASSKTSKSAAFQPVVSDASIADDSELTIDVDTAGTGAKGLKIMISGIRL